MNPIELNNIGTMDLRGIIVEESPNSMLVTAKREFYVPERKIILVDQMTEHESQLLMNVKK